MSILTEKRFAKNRDLELSRVHTNVLRKRLAKQLSTLKALYRELTLEPPKSDSEREIFENFYTIERSAKLALKNKSKLFLTCDSQGIPLISKIFLGECTSSHADFPDEKLLIEAIKRVQNVVPLTTEDFEMQEFSLNFALLDCIYSVTFGKSTFTKLSLLEMISLLKKVSTIDFEEIISKCDPIEQVFLADPIGIYRQCDSTTRRIYRSKTSRSASAQGRAETDVANEYLKLAVQNDRHVGFYIFQNDKRRRLPPKAYMLILTVGTALISLALGLFAESLWLSIVVFLPIWEIFRTVVDISLQRFSSVTYLPRLSADCSTVKNERCVVVITTILNSKDDVFSLVKRLREQFFITRDSACVFCAMCDLQASRTEISPSDNEILTTLNAEIEALNNELGGICCCVRKRSFCGSLGNYCGWERKRGAVLELARLCGGKLDRSDFALICGDSDKLFGAELIVLLDSDTVALMDSVRSLVAIALHPLNAPKVENGKVVSGFGIITPRISTSLESSMRSPFSKLFGGIGSSSAYDEQCCNLYQDAFGEGVFSGKGLVRRSIFDSLCSDFFKENVTLSHDIIEGELLRCGFAGDVEFRESFPASTHSYFKRQNRWARGDIQNSRFLLRRLEGFSERAENPISSLGKFKIADNIRRTVTPIVQFFGLFLTFTLPSRQAVILSLVLASSVAVPYALSLVGTLIGNGFYSVSRKYYSGVISQFTETVTKLFFSLLFLPLNAVTSLFALATSMWRMLISHKRLLEWQPFSQGDGFSLRGAIPLAVSEILSAVLILSPDYFTRFLSLIMIFQPFAMAVMNKPYSTSRNLPDEKKAEELIKQVKDMWQYYARFATEENSFLPPDNVQFAPCYRICRRTSPTNIGMYLLSCLAVCDFGIITSDELFRRVERVVSSVERLEKYSGNLYNWYETVDLSLSPNPFVSTVDSGNFVCALVALKEGLREHCGESVLLPDRQALIRRVERLIDETDLSVFYNERLRLFSIGIDPTSNSLSPYCYDLLMSEARMTSYFAVAKRVAPKRHWRQLARTMSRCGLYSGAISFSGTMFEFLMPEILLKSTRGSLSFESVHYCLYCQRLRAKRQKVPFGISESGYFAFDNALNYQYKAHGVQKIGLRRGLDSDLVVSPYSTYLALMVDFDGAFDNLERLKSYGMYGQFGFYEAVDFTQGRAERFGTIIKSYMAHHVGMSICATANACFDGIMQSRFLADCDMNSARELLEEKTLVGAVIFEDFAKPSLHAVPETPYTSEFFEEFSPSVARVKLLANGEYTLAITASGICTATYRNRDVYARTTDLFLQPRGVFFAVEVVGEKGSEVLDFCYYPTMQNAEDLGSEFGEDYVSFYRNGNGLECGMRVQLHNTLPCEIRQLAVKNVSSKALEIKLLSYIEPVLQGFRDSIAHPAFSKLFLKISYDYERQCVIVSRKNRHNDDKLFCAIGLVEGGELFCCFSREKVLERPNGTLTLFRNAEKIGSDHSFIPDPCVYSRLGLTLAPNEQREVHFFILVGESSDELFDGIDKLRGKSEPIARAMPPIADHSIEGRIATAILPQLIFKRRDSSEQIKSISQNRLRVSELWRFSISTDVDIILVEVTSRGDYERISCYLKAFKSLKLCSIACQLVFAYVDGGEYGGVSGEILTTICELGLSDLINAHCGIFTCDLAKYGGFSGKIALLLRAVAVHSAPSSLIRIGTPILPFTMPKIHPVEPRRQSVSLETAFGGYDGDSFVINERPPTNWCHVLASQQFGTLVSYNSLGFTYAVNSHENKLTEWRNDPAFDNRGELLLLRADGKIYDLCLGSSAVFSDDKAEYFGSTELFDSKVEVSVSRVGFCKKIRTEIRFKSKTDCELAFYAEPILATDRTTSRLISPKRVGRAIVLTNPANLAVKGFMAISGGDDDVAVTSREAFFLGKWREENVGASTDLCVALTTSFCGKSLVKEFFITFGATEKSALEMPSLYRQSGYTTFSQNEITIKTPDKALDCLFNHWLFRQTLGGRIFARTGFYQNSGAFGFRDQLQDCCAVMLKNPQIAKRIIARACTAQFAEGDVMHWWHSLPSGVMRGVRTKISDDLVFLPYTVAEYVEKTGDRAFLTVGIAYCEGIEIPQSENEIYGEVRKSSKRHSVYNHCKTALSHAYQTGRNGLILMGSGDWNDSFNGVGIGGEGESVWLTQFMIIVLRRFVKICEMVGDEVTAEEFLLRADELSRAVCENAWDGEWYVRAFFDDGKPLGSKACTACRIDSLTQSFATLCGLPNRERNEIALSSALQRLFDKKNGIVKLFTPPFEENGDVGYASAYPAGIRENGGQYTHSAIWLAIALFEAGRGDEGFELIKALNPYSKTFDADSAERFKNEPYYMTADIYTNPQCYGRGGWSIYTGASGWYYRAIFEWLLGVKIKDGRVYFSPFLPKAWEECAVELVYLETVMSIKILRSEGGDKKTTDNGVSVEFIPLDKERHEVHIFI